MVFNKNFSTPLRYPGGKSRISSFLEDIILLNNLEGCNLYELYAGGAGASINLLFSGLCNKVVLNDLDKHIYSFWWSVINGTESLIRLINDSEVTIDNWNSQKYIYDNHKEFSNLEIGFSTFFLNRTNRSGILYKAGPIGGMKQTGNYKMDVRFNKGELISRIIKIAKFSSSLEIHNKESFTFLKYIVKRKKKKFIFLDPPYYNQGENLYLNFYTDNDHFKLSKLLQDNQNTNWLLTYDNCDRIIELYRKTRKAYLPMTYTLQSKKKDKEIMMVSNSLFLPKQLKIGSHSSLLNLLPV